MRKVLAVALLAAFAAGTTGCIAVATPASGLVFTSVDWSTQVPKDNRGNKSGSSSASSLMGLLAWGDATVDSAAKDGGISNVKSVEHSSSNFFGLWGTFTTTVTGD